jgi:hypothetical protein
MAFWQPHTAEKAERLRRLGLYAGPTFLALMLGRAIYEVACDRWRFALVRSRESIESAAFFIVIGLLLAWVARAPLSRLGWLALGALHVIVLFGPWAGYLPDRWMLNALYVAFAALITLGGVRGATRGAVALAACAFIAVLAFSYVSRHYVDVLLERHSVLRASPLC